MKLKLRIADLAAATSIHDILLGNPEISGQNCAISLTSDAKLFLQQNYPPSYRGVTNLDWSEVGRVKIMRVAHVE